MEIVDLQLMVEGGLAGGAVALAARLTRAFPFDAPGEARRGAIRSLALASLVAALCLGLTAHVERLNRAAGGFLPAAPHPRGWRYELEIEPQGIVYYDEQGNVLEGPERAARSRRELEASKARNALHRAVERARIAHALLPLVVVWALALVFTKRVPALARVGALALLAPAALSLHVLITLGCYSALTGD